MGKNSTQTLCQFFVSFKQILLTVSTITAVIKGKSRFFALMFNFLTKKLNISDSEIFIPDSNARYAPREYKKRAVVLLLSPQANNRISFIATTLPRKRGDGNFTT